MKIKDIHKDFELIDRGEYLNLTKFEQSLYDNPLPKRKYEKYEMFSKGGKEFIKERTLSEIRDYKLYFIKNKVFRWLNDGKLRFLQIIHDKEKSIKIYEKKVNFNDKCMIKCLENKKIRLKHYINKVALINHLINDYHNYSYEYLCSMPDIIFRHECDILIVKKID